MRILDLGCGWAKESGAIGLDRVPLETVDVVTDLSEFPYPFASGTFDKIILNDVIEHLPDTIKAMEEIYRLCTPGARVFIRVINWNSELNAMDPTHVRKFHEKTFNFFGAYKDRAYYSNARFEVVEVKKIYSARARKLLWNNQRLLEFASYFLNNVLEDLHFELKAEKPAQPLSIKGGLREILRCPHCVAGRTRKPGPDPGRLQSVDETWLVCTEQDCNRKYPLYVGLPVFFRDITEEYKSFPQERLPSPPSPEDYTRISNPLRELN